VDQSGNVALTHGELPCPACGYQRRGLALDIACPECGARGFEGELIVSGLPGLERESHLGGCVYQIGHLLFMASLAGLPLILGKTAARNSPWNTILTVGGTVIGGIALAVFISGVLRRRRERRANLSLERVVIEFRSEVVVVRDRTDERTVPLRAIKAITVQIDSPTKKTRVWISAPSAQLPSRGSAPTIVLVGDLPSQRIVKADMERRVRERPP
jgi:hypothetical protein